MTTATQTKRKTAAKSTRQTPAKRRTSNAPAPEAHVLHVHTAHPTVPVPYLTAHDMTATARAAADRLPDLPPPRDLAFYGGLGAMAVVGALEWPVAAAIGAATAIVRSGGQRRKR